MRKIKVNPYLFLLLKEITRQSARNFNSAGFDTSDKQVFNFLYNRVKSHKNEFANSTYSSSKNRDSKAFNIVESIRKHLWSEEKIYKFTREKLDSLTSLTTNFESWDKFVEYFSKDQYAIEAQLTMTHCDYYELDQSQINLLNFWVQRKMIDLKHTIMINQLADDGTPVYFIDKDFVIKTAGEKDLLAIGYLDILVHDIINKNNKEKSIEEKFDGEEYYMLYYQFYNRNNFIYTVCLDNSIIAKAYMLFFPFTKDVLHRIIKDGSDISYLDILPHDKGFHTDFIFLFEALGRGPELPVKIFEDYFLNIFHNLILLTTKRNSVHIVCPYGQNQHLDYAVSWYGFRELRELPFFKDIDTTGFYYLPLLELVERIKNGISEPLWGKT